VALLAEILIRLKPPEVHGCKTTSATLTLYRVGQRALWIGGLVRLAPCGEAPMEVAQFKIDMTGAIVVGTFDCPLTE
jgi:hypothetical protein